MAKQAKPAAEARLTALQRAMAFHQRGDLAEAERLYRTILHSEPDQFDALHLLGVVRLQQRRNSEAVDLIAAALRVRPDVVEALCNLAKGLALLGRAGEALASFDRALAIRPDNSAILFDRAVVLARLSRHDEALACHAHAVALNPANTAALYQMGCVLQALGRHSEAIASFERALAAKHDWCEALDRRGVSLNAVGRAEEALASHAKAVAVRPDFWPALVNRGNTLRGMRRFAEALACYDKALALNPALPDALNNRGLALKELRRWAEALASYDQALLVAPSHVEALCNRGTVLMLLGRGAEAIEDYDRALALRPESADVHFNRAAALTAQRQFEAALASYDRALALAPDHPLALGAAEAALAVCDFARTAKAAIALPDAIGAGRAAVTPFVLLGLSDDPALQLQCAQNYLADRMPLMPEPRRRSAPARHGKIRIAYLSADFHDHATAHLAVDLFERHDRSRFEVLGVSYGVDDGSAMRLRLAKAFDRFCEVREMPDRQTAQMLSELDVHIAIDLKGHTRDARPEILAYRPAPIAVNYLGYPGTMGAAFIDYMLADPIVAPFADQPFFAERIVHLPDCYQPNPAQRRTAERTPSRSAAGLPEEGFVFCCFNASYKVTAPVFDVWIRLLRNVPGSVLWLLGDNAGAERNLRQEAQARGIDPVRLVFAPRVAVEEHLTRQRLADLFLDTLPINAHTTASDALWAGLPLVTCRGQSFVARVAASILHAAGLDDLVTGSLAEYEACALRLATDPALMGSVRRRLTANRDTCPLFDLERYRRHIEAAYITMWENWQRGEPPQSFSVPLDFMSRSVAHLG